MTSDAEIIWEARGCAGLITLNRPQALNALTLKMVREMRAALDEFERDPSITRVIVTGTGGKAFCAGGDIRLMYDQGKAGRTGDQLTFWREEYLLNIRIKRYPKPYISLIDGIVMGGGVGISLHGSHRVAGERYLFAMPEVGIGFFPDVGATYALPRLPGKTGTWLALTGDRIGPADALELGLATHHVPSAAMSRICDDLIAGADIEEVLVRHKRDPGPAPTEAERVVIDAAFAGLSVGAIMKSLNNAASFSTFAGTALRAMLAKSPTSMAIALEQMLRGASLSFENAMALEMRVVTRIAAGHDFYEGVRAVIVDKDHQPRWRPAKIEMVTGDEVLSYFAPLAPAGELPIQQAGTA